MSIHILYIGFTPVHVGQDGLSGTPVYASVCQFTLVYICGQGRGAQQCERNRLYIIGTYLCKMNDNKSNKL